MKRIVICCDGTWNTPDEESHGQSCQTNVAKMAALIAPADEKGITQVTYYHDGVGTDNFGDKVAGGAFGVGLSENIGEAYRFLASNYLPEDEIWLFGFSRGAYTARSIIGLIRNSGLLKKCHLDRFSSAYQLYRDRSKDTDPNSDVALNFKNSFSYIPDIHFLGVWDTIGSLGVPDYVISRFLGHTWDFHDVTLSSTVKHAFHALAIDERRADFKPCLWDGPNTDDRRQVWFPGAHSDVGGGYPETGLSDCALTWMMTKAAGCGLALDCANVDVAPDFHADIHDSKTGFFHLRPAYVRPVEPEVVSRSAVQKKSAVVSGYNPSNWPPSFQEEVCKPACACSKPGKTGESTIPS